MNRYVSCTVTALMLITTSCADGGGKPRVESMTVDVIDDFVYLVIQGQGFGDEQPEVLMERYTDSEQWSLPVSEHGDTIIRVVLPEGMTPDWYVITLDTEYGTVVVPLLALGGVNGVHCWDLDGDGEIDLATEDVNEDGVVNALDCHGVAGEPGLDCWDLNGDGVQDDDEDLNGDGLWNVLDCRGQDGYNALVEITEATTTECEYGGIHVTTGIDLDRDGVLDTEEVDSDRLLCFDATGGLDGLTSLVSVTDEPAGINCPFGGKKVETGLDLNDNGMLDTTEVESTMYLCGNELVEVSTESPGTNCTAGGVRIETGLDDNGDGDLSPSEVDDVLFACNGIDGIDGTNGTDGVDGADGATTLVRIEPEPPGTICTYGGNAIHVGIDTDGDGYLDPGEITDTAYACNGADGGSYTCDVGEIRYVVCGMLGDGEQRQVCDSSHVWQNEGPCVTTGGGTAPTRLDWVFKTSFTPWTCFKRSTVVYAGEMWIINGRVVYRSSDGITWVREADAPFSTRCDHAAVAHGGKIWVTGGESGGTYFADIWSFDGSTWTEEVTSAPFGGREGHTTLAFGGGIYLVGGKYVIGSTHYYRNDVWFSSDGVTWIELADPGPFRERAYHGAGVYNGNLWIMHGSYTYTGGTYNDDVWRTPDGTHWIQTSAHTPFGQRVWPTVVDFDSKLWVIGGYSQYDVWYSTDGTTWTESMGYADFLNADLAAVVYNSKIYLITEEAVWEGDVV